MTVWELRRALRVQADSVRAGERARDSEPGAHFLGVELQLVHALAAHGDALSPSVVHPLLRSHWQEERLLALLILVRQYTVADPATREAIHALYLRQRGWVTGRALVDASAPTLVGAHVADGDRSVLERLALSGNVWERRIALIACVHLARRGDVGDARRLGERYAHDGSDVVYEAAQWLLKELDSHAASTSRSGAGEVLDTFASSPAQHPLWDEPPALQAAVTA